MGGHGGRGMATLRLHLGRLEQGPDFVQQVKENHRDGQQHEHAATTDGAIDQAILETAAAGQLVDLLGSRQDIVSGVGHDNSSQVHGWTVKG